MIKVFVMSTCPDCRLAKEQFVNDPDYQLIDIGEHVRNLKNFLQLRDHHPAFDEAKVKGYIGIPCYLFEDGSVRFSLDDMPVPQNSSSFSNNDVRGMDSTPEGESCSLDGKGC